jgi:membrane peptidoglycan carboxypeptidase
MVAAGYLSPTRAELIWMEPLRLADSRPQSERRARYFVDYLLQTALPEALGPELAARGGFTVTTTLDRSYDERLAELARDHVSRLRAAHNLNAAAVVALRPGSGEILAMVGGADYDNPVDGQVNMAVSPRQLGSTFKPIAYATAMEAGMTPATVLWDVPYEFNVGGGIYKPVNYDGVYRGPVRLRHALANSMNAAAIDISAQLGVVAIHAKSRELGLGLDPDPAQYGLSIVLGGGAVSLLEMVGAYANFADQGRFIRPTGILDVVSLGDGKSMFHPDRKPVQAFSPQTAWMMSDILSDSEARRIAFGDGASLRLSRPAAVKTGTSNDFRDNTTIGYTPYLAVGVWTGNKDNQPMRNVLGITGAAPIWNAAMEAAFADEDLMLMLGDHAMPRDGFERPIGLASAEVCDLLTLTSAGDCRRYTEWYPLTGLPEGRQPAFGAFTLGQEGAGRCAMAVGSPEVSGSSIMLNVARPPGMAATIRDWASSRGVRVAPPPCAVAQQGG